jgi:hypothetical protein
MGKQLFDLAVKDKWDNVVPRNVHPSCSYLNPHKHHIGILSIQVLTFLEHVSVVPFNHHQVKNTSTSMEKYAMEEAWLNGMTITCCRKVSK